MLTGNSFYQMLKLKTEQERDDVRILCSVCPDTITMLPSIHPACFTDKEKAIIASMPYTDKREVFQITCQKYDHGNLERGSLLAFEWLLTNVVREYCKNHQKTHYTVMYIGDPNKEN